MNSVERELSFQNLISTLSASFNTIESNKIDEEINKTISKLATSLNADRCMLLVKNCSNQNYQHEYKYSKDELILSNAYIPNFENQEWAKLDRDINKDYGSIILRSQNCSLNKNIKSEKVAFNTSMRILLNSRSGSKGVFAFDSLSANEEWNYDLVPGLRVAGETILNTLDLIRAENQISFSERKYQDLVEMSQGLIYKCNDKSEFTYLNPAWEYLLGYQIKDMIGKSFIEFMPKRVNLRDLKTHEDIYSGNPVSEYETIFLTKDGKEKIIVFTGIPEYSSSGEIIGTQGTGFDITDRKQMENDLIDSRNRLRLLAIEISQNEQKHNKKLAGIIHDSMGQEIAMLKVSLGQLTTMDLPDIAHRTICNTRDKLEDLLNITRDLIQNLYPPVLNEMGLISAIEWLGNSFLKNHNINFSFQYRELPFKFNEDVSQTLYLIVKELIVNAIKHSNASTLEIQVDFNTRKFYMSIFDDGKGISNTPCKYKNCGFGLINTKERIENLNGYFVINKLTKGTEISIGLPLNRELLVCV